MEVVAGFKVDDVKLLVDDLGLGVATVGSDGPRQGIGQVGSELGLTGLGVPGLVVVVCSAYKWPPVLLPGTSST